MSELRRCIELPHQEERDEFQRFAANHLFIRTEQFTVVPFVLRPLQLEFHRDFTGRDYVDKARKHGISTYVAARFYWQVTTQRNAGAAMVAHSPGSTEMLWQIVQLFYEMDPRRKSGDLTTRYESRRELFFDQLNSFFRVYTAGKGSGRGGTINYLHVSEFAWWDKDARATFAGLESSVPPPDQGTEVVIESTANGEGNEFHRGYSAAVEGKSPYAAHFFPWYEHPLYVAKWHADWGEPDEEERALQKLYGLSLEQLAFRRERIASIGLDQFNQEYPFTWEESFLSSGRPAFDRRILNILAGRYARDPIEQIRDGENYVRIFEAPVPGRQYVAGVDMSEGVRGGDAQDISILDFETLDEVASMNGRWPIHVFARKSAALVRSYQAFTCPESNNHGHALLEHWIHGVDELRVPVELLYHHKDYNAKGKVQRKPGWNTNDKTRPIMVADLEEFIRRGWIHIRDREFYAEARAFAYQDNGKPEAPEGMHDDRVISRALALQARKEAAKTVGFSARRLRPGL